MFTLLILQDVKFLFEGAKYFACFSRFLTIKDNSKKWTPLRNQIPSPLPTPFLTRLSYSNVNRVKMFVLKHWIFFEQKLDRIFFYKQMLDDTECMKVISTENVEKIVEEVRRKNQSYLFSKLLGD